MTTDIIDDRVRYLTKTTILGCIKCEKTICFQCFYLVMSKGKEDATICCGDSDYKPLDEFYKKKEKFNITYVT